MALGRRLGIAAGRCGQRGDSGEHGAHVSDRQPRLGRARDGGFLGAKHNPFNALGRKPREKPQGMVLQGITLERLRDRDRLRQSFDRFRRDADVANRMQSIDAYTQQALGILTTSKLGDALDLSKEDPKILERYGKSDEAFRRDGAPRMVESFCIARRLVEAGRAMSRSTSAAGIGTAATA